MSAYRVVSRLEAMEVREPMAAADAGSPLRSPAMTADLLRRYGLHTEAQEVFCALLLDSKHRLMAYQEVSRGTLNSSLVHPREVFGAALRLGNVAALIIAHNHPSGDPEPSPEDLAITRRLVEAGNLLGLRVLDHVILGGNESVSLAERGQMGGGA